MSPLWDCISPSIQMNPLRFQRNGERRERPKSYVQGEKAFCTRAAQSSLATMLPHSGHLGRWAEKQSPDSGRMPVMGGPDCHPTTRRVRDAALFCKPGRNRSMKPLEPELSLMDFCPLSPATTVSTLSSSGMFLQQPKIVSKNVSQKKGQGYTVLAHPFCEAKMRTLIFISDIFYYCFKGRE